MAVMVGFLWKGQGQDRRPALNPFCFAGPVAVTPLALSFRGKPSNISSFTQFPFQRKQRKVTRLMGQSGRKSLEFFPLHISFSSPEQENRRTKRNEITRSRKLLLGSPSTDCEPAAQLVLYLVASGAAAGAAVGGALMAPVSLSSLPAFP